MFKIGIGPSSSHTMGPMVAAKRFVDTVFAQGKDKTLGGVRVDIYGSLALTGEGHGTCDAMLNGLEGNEPKTVDPDRIKPRAAELRAGANLNFGGKMSIPFIFRKDVVLHKDELLPKHTNGMLFTAMGKGGDTLLSLELYSIGGGFVVSADEFGKKTADKPDGPYPFGDSAQLLELCHKNNMTIAQLVMANEKTWRSEAEVRAGLLEIAGIMRDCVEKGCERTEQFLPGGFEVRRRAPGLCARMSMLKMAGRKDIRLWPMLYAIAVAEENASGGRIVTAPTNGAAGIVPAVARYYRDFVPYATDEGLLRYFLTAGAIGILYKENASISGAEVGCQGEVGVACSMAAAGLVGALEGTNEQIEHAAEIGMEHHLGMTCDPVAGLVQIPCIERNAFGAVKAVNACRLAMQEQDAHKISLDQVIRTMYQTGLDMQRRYKETSLGGLAVNAVNC
jgi:L-serine dehydratase